MTPFRVGDIVVATRDGGHDKDGLPRERPTAGKTYRITSIYEMSYGLDCTLEGLDPRPYRGYFLRVDNGPKHNRGEYFKPMEKADDEFTKTLYEYIRSNEDADKPEHQPGRS